MTGKIRQNIVADATDSLSETEELWRVVADLRERLRVAQQTIDELQREARQDPLTGLQNRRGLLIEVERAIDMVRRYGDSASVLFIDLDNFKQVNDSFGHEMGDLVLTQLAGLLRSNVRRSDTVARIGGDEFVVLMTHSDYETARDKAGTLERLVSEAAVTARGEPLAIAASVGATAIEKDDKDASEVLSRADKAMYVAKKGKSANLKR